MYLTFQWLWSNIWFFCVFYLCTSSWFSLIYYFSFWGSYNILLMAMFHRLSYCCDWCCWCSCCWSFHWTLKTFRFKLWVFLIDFFDIFSFIIIHSGILEIFLKCSSSNGAHCLECICRVHWWCWDRRLLLRYPCLLVAVVYLLYYLIVIWCSRGGY